MDIRQSAIDRTALFESFIPHFYLDTKNRVTVGCGEMIPSSGDAESLTLYRQDGSDADDGEKSSSWTTVSTAAKNKPATWYGKLTTIRMKASDADVMLKASLTQAAKDLLKRFPSLDQFPEQAQDALLDMMFNIGVTKFNKTAWPSLFAAVGAQDWKTAAAQSNRTDVPLDRNEAIKALFLEAVGDPLVEVQSFDSLRQAFREQVDDTLTLIDRARELPKLFPGGITKIQIGLTAGGVELTLEISGPEGGKALSSKTGDR